MARRRFGLGPSSLVVELASNDGYLLKNFLQMGIPVLGIDPSDTVARAAERIGVPTLVEFFGETLARKLAERGPCGRSHRRQQRARARAAAQRFRRRHRGAAEARAAPRPSSSRTCSKLIEHVEFDTIYHEHYSYLSLTAIEHVFSRHGLRLYDAEELPTHGGSLRIFATHAERPGLPDSAALRALRAQEAAAGLSDLDTYRRFADRVEACRRALLDFLARAKRESKRVAAYGAAAKGNTLLNFCGVTPRDIALVADRNPHKQGKLLPGTHIPVVSPEALMAGRPDYVLILPWNLEHEIRRQLDGIRAWGGRFVTAVPQIAVDP